MSKFGRAAMRDSKKVVFGVVMLLGSMLAACNLPEAAQSTTSRMNDIQTEAALLVTSEFITPTITVPPLPTKTQIANTPTSYPTFYPELAVTVTLAQPALCPAEDSAFEFNEDMLGLLDGRYVSEFVRTSIDAGASFSQIYSKANQLNSLFKVIYFKDLTGDKVKELVIGTDGELDVYSCISRVYKNVFHLEAVSANPSDIPEIIQVSDMNLNNVPDIVLSYLISEDGDKSISIIEWNGEVFQQMLVYNHGPHSESSSRIARGLQWNLNSDEYFWMSCQADLRIRDIDYNGTKEIIVKDAGPCDKQTFYETGPWLGQQVTFTWNGESFLLSDYQIDSPVYRYQALQEADRLFLMRDYDQASILYDKVIASEVLEWYSMDRKKYLWDVYSAKQAGRNISEIPGPYFRADEYQYLSAYARYRKMMLLLAEGKQADAYYVYQLLDQIYTQQNPGFWHAEMGRIYWKAVEEGMSLTDACQPVIEYVEQNPKLLEALGDQWHGQQSHIYTAADVCPLDEMDIELLSGNS